MSQRKNDQLSKYWEIFHLNKILNFIKLLSFKTNVLYSSLSGIDEIKLDSKDNIMKSNLRNRKKTSNSLSKIIKLSTQNKKLRLTNYSNYTPNKLNLALVDV